MTDKIAVEKDGELFICGVVEGFYGRPWTKIQREELFKKLKKWGFGKSGVSSYVYAPKDDYKHRAYWRELYTVEEADHLSSLIAAAKEHGVRFYYALSPGLDMTYSSPKEIQTLKRKLDQVMQFGCNAFALLFDDIDSELCKADKEMFQTFANAQVSVTNEIYTHLGNPHFLFCPTQYCSSRAVPNVRASEYLNTLGSKLNNDIDILWTGDKVISKTITLESIQEITEVLRRPPVIWDNLHANDYDQKRVFLGPYTGRSPSLIPHLRGVLTNPNCEFHANTIAINTLAYWSKCSLDAKVNSSLSADIKLETENEDGTSAEDLPIECCTSENIYHPKIALKNALIEWLPEFFIEKEAWGPITKPQPQVTMVMPIIPIIPSINTCMSLTTTTTTSTTTKTVTVPEVNTTQLQALADVCSTVNSSSMNPISNPVMNSLVSPTKVVMNEEIPNPIPTNVASNIELPKKIPISVVSVPIMENAKTLDPESDTETSATTTTITTNIEMDSTLIMEQEMKDGDDVIDNDIKLEENQSPNIEQARELKLKPCNKNENNLIEDDDIRIDEKAADDASSIAILPIDTDDNNLSPLEAMECNSLNSQISPRDGRKAEEDVMMTETSSVPENCMQVESAEPSPLSNEMKDIDVPTSSMEPANSINEQVSKYAMKTESGSSTAACTTKPITLDDLYLLCDLFYLPFEHGNRGSRFLSEFNWLKANAYLLLVDKATTTSGAKKSTSTSDNKPEIEEWFLRAETFNELCESVQKLMGKIANCANKEICYDLFTYIWDIASTLILLNAYVKWLSLRHFPHNIYTFTQGTYTWFSKGWKEAFMSGDQEPWVFRGGLIADLQRLMPVDSGNDLFLYKLPELPRSNYAILRPYQYTDESAVYEVCARDFLQRITTATESLNENNSTQLRDLIADSIIGPFLTFQPEFSMIAQDSSIENTTILGYCAAALDVQVLARNTAISWLPEMQEKYAHSTLIEAINANKSTTASPLNGIIDRFLKEFQNPAEDYQCPVEVSSTYPAVLVMAVTNNTPLSDESLIKRLLTVILAALRSNGCFGVHVRLMANDSSLADETLHFNRIGFAEIYRNERYVYLGRRF